MGCTRACLAALLVLAAAQVASAEVKLQSVTRKINLNSQFAKVSETIKVKNTGNDAVSSLILCQARRDAVLAFQQVSQQVKEQKETLKVTMPSPKVKSFSQTPSPVTKMEGNKYKYGKYDLVKRGGGAEMRLHYENNKPFKKVWGGG
ncbi:hypothetical protein DUNSADRAFT_4548 [Dunaliella salina]|uniref:Dolichyl-diphosphooligosaccharide--protein glycosyltransferase subunit 1 n=1 Tax=Dunaliella salina TaxID=3046 RepID=A0ABQ7FUS6_DUNSA|nr:hypothetical protein DUNSADRAFT_4548 [Dunaliella salina]|eukprot:KAF5826147.1 hypothetical protein DUNSADRAFT_4548 [Dunaliella salina]